MSSFAIKEIERRQKKGIELNETIIDDGFIHIIAGELIPGEIGADRDNVATWREFFDIVSQFSFWWRYVLAFHGLFGWRACVNRSVLNVVDSKVLGFVSITISKFV